MTREAFVTRWRGRRDELARLGAHVDGAKLCDEVLADVEAMLTSEDEARQRLSFPCLLVSLSPCLVVRAEQQRRQGWAERQRVER